MILTAMVLGWVGSGHKKARLCGTGCGVPELVLVEREGGPLKRLVKWGGRPPCFPWKGVLLGLILDRVFSDRGGNREQSAHQEFYGQ